MVLGSSVPEFTIETTRSAYVPSGPGALLFARAANEDRARLTEDWISRAARSDVAFVGLEQLNGTSMLAHLAAGPRTCALRSVQEVGALLEDIEGILYVDITGLDHAVWAVILRAALTAGREVEVLYAEPRRYRRDPLSIDGMFFDLSSGGHPLGSLPGFARIDEDQRAEDSLVLMLGFEAARSAQVLEQLESPRGSVTPIIGVPGFRPEYSQYALVENRDVIIDNGLARSVRLVRANCPFSAFDAIRRVHRDGLTTGVRIALVGTKPHALGGVLYALCAERDVQLYYDFPERKAGRSEGSGSLCRYLVSEFVKSPLFSGQAHA